jgi:hypothetical protein
MTMAETPRPLQQGMLTSLATQLKLSIAQL